MSQLLGAVLLISLLLPCAAVRADDLQKLSRRLAAQGKKLKTLEARFVQRKRLALFKSEVTSKGRLFFARPGRLRWEILPPDASVLVVRGKRAELRVPGEKTRVMDLTTNKTLGVLVEQLMIWLGGVIVLPLVTWPILRSIFKAESNAANAATLAIYSLAAWGGAFALCGFAIAGWGTALLLLAALLAAFVYNFRIFTRIEESR